MFKNLWDDFVRAMRLAIGRMVRAGLAGLLIGALAVEVTALVVDGRWPPHTSHLIVHVAAGAFALLLAYAAVTTVMLIEGVRGLAAGVSRLDDVARAGAEVGLNVLDAMVDSVDGPNRYGFRGLRDPASVPVPSIAQVSPIVAESLPPIPPAAPAPRRDQVGEHHPTWPAMTPVPSESWR